MTVGLGAMLLRLSLGGDFQRYVRSGMRPYLLVAGGVLIVLGVASGWSGRHGDAGDGHDHGPGLAPAAGLFLLVPLVTVFLVSPPALGSYAAARSAVVRSQLRPATSLPSARNGAVDLSVSDFSDRTSFGQDLTQGRFRLLGFVTEDPKGLPGRFLLTRLKIACCAADAQTSQVMVVGATSVPRPGTWLSVVGSETVDDQGHPELEALSQQRVSAPSDPYE